MQAEQCVNWAPYLVSIFLAGRWKRKTRIPRAHLKSIHWMQMSEFPWMPSPSIVSTRSYVAEAAVIRYRLKCLRFSAKFKLYSIYVNEKHTTRILHSMEVSSWIRCQKNISALCPAWTLTFLSALTIKEKDVFFPSMIEQVYFEVK